MRRKLVVFTDLDGTLLDHHSYSWEPARPALEALQTHQIPVVLCSSKTRAEITALRDDLQNDHPFIVENGAAVIIPHSYFDQGSGFDKGSDRLGHGSGSERLQPTAEASEQTVSFGTSRGRILEVLDYLRREGFRFRSFAAMSTSELAGVTGLSDAAADRAKIRTATEPLLWEGHADSLELFRGLLARYRLQLLEGGRFFHVMGYFDKSDAMEYLLERYRVFYQKQDVVSVALGDSPNDARMLEQADIPVIIRGVEAHKVRLPNRSNAIYSQEKGPAGWNACILQILNETCCQSAESLE